jgi:type VI secretion system secreted protein VgrG
MARLLEINTPLGQDNTFLLNLSTKESLGSLPEYNLTLIAKKQGVKASDFLGKNVTVGLEMPGGRELRYFNGYITRFSDAGVTSASYFQEGDRGRAYVYHLTMHPWLWFLTRRADCRIFQKKSIPDIISEVCQAYPFAQLEKQLSGNYSPWEYCCQYRESDFNFISRLMEQEGIYFFFKHEDGKHSLVLCDSPGAHQPRKGYANIPYSETGTEHADEKEHITTWHISHEVQPGRYTLNDFDFENPTVDLVAKASHPESHDLSNFEYYDYPGEYELRSDGEQYAQIRLEELHSQFEVISGAGNVRGIETGCTFKLTDHPFTAHNREFLVTGTSYSITNNQPGSGGGGGDFHCSFQIIGARTPFRPQRLTPKPIVQGPQTAIVVGPAGEEIHVDKHGRVKVQFHWDRYNDADDKSSCWVRVSQPWASKGWGAMFLPRIGHEVIVEFLEGDPDRPIITGRVYNGQSMPPWVLPANKTRSGFKTRTYKGSSSNFNELSFDDKQGSEEIFIHAEKDKVVRIKNKRTEYVGNESHRIIEKDYREQTKADHHATIKGDENVKLEEGSYSLKVAEHWQGKMGGMILAEAGAEIHLKSAASIFTKAAKNIDAKSDQHIRFKSQQDTQMKVGMNMAVDAGMEVHLKGGMNVVIEAGMSITLKAGGGFIVVGPAGVTISGTPVLINSGGSAGSGSGCTPPEDGTACNPTAPKAPEEARGAEGGEDMKPVKPAKPQEYSPQAQALKLAWQAGTPFCAQCAAAAAAAAAKGQG